MVREGDVNEREAMAATDKAPGNAKQARSEEASRAERRVAGAAEVSSPQKAAAMAPARAPARAADTGPHADFAAQVRDELQQPMSDEASFRLRSSQVMSAKGYSEYRGRNDTVTVPERDIDTKDWRFHMDGTYVGPGAVPSIALYPLEQVRQIYRGTVAGPLAPGHITEDDSGRILVGYFQAVSRLAMMAGVDRKVVNQNPEVAIILMRAAIARQVGIGRTEGAKGAQAIEYVITKRLPPASQLAR